MLIKSFCICICRIRIRLFAHLWTVACAHPWISPISSTQRPNLRQRMGIIVKWKSFLRKELLVHNFLRFPLYICTIYHAKISPFFVHNFLVFLSYLVMTKKIIFCVFLFFVFFFHMLWYVQFSSTPSLLDAILRGKYAIYASNYT